MARSVHITRVYHFSAAHQLASAALSPSENVALYGDSAALAKIGRAHV